MDRRIFLLGGVASLVAGGAAVYGWSRMLGDSRQRVEGEAARLTSDTGVLLAEIEERGTRLIIDRLTHAQDFFAALGEDLYRREDFELYWRMFSPKLITTADAEHGLHVAGFWEDFLDISGDGTPAGDALRDLNNRVAQHAPYFGQFGDSALREQRRKDLVWEHWREMESWTVNGDLRLEFERAQLERDIGKFYLVEQELLGERLPQAQAAAAEAAEAWMATHRRYLMDVMPSVSLTNVREAALMQNPFV